jgi:hypothetical protein
MRARTVLVLLLLALIPAQLAHASGAGTTSRRRPIAALSGPISNGRTTSYWAYPAEAAPVRTHARVNSRKVDTLRFKTEDGFPEVYLVLAQVVYPHETWFEVRLPGRPNGRTGWVREQELGALHVNHYLVVVDERRLRLTLYKKGHEIFSAPVGVGKPSTPTPTGHYWIREKFTVQPADPFYGPYAFGTADYSTLSEWPHGGIVGIHGTNEPWLIPGRPSHGCIRMKDSDVTRLWGLLPIGTPVTIRY